MVKDVKKKRLVKEENPFPPLLATKEGRDGGWRERETEKEGRE